MMFRLSDGCVEFVSPETLVTRVRGCQPDDVEHVGALVTVARHRGGSLTGAVEAGRCAARFARRHGVFEEAADDSELGPGELLAYVAARGDLIVGFLAMKAYARQVQILELIVDSVFRGQGIGTQLLATALEVACGYDVGLCAVVRGTDCRGLSWLCARGFRVYARDDGRPWIEENVFAEACDAIVIVRELNT